MAIDKTMLTKIVNETCAKFQHNLERQGVNATGIHSDQATSMLLAIAAHESHFFTYPYQIGGGPGRGLFMMEISQGNIMGTEESIWSHWFKYRKKWRMAMTNTCGVISPHPHNQDAMVTKLRYQICMGRVYLWMVPEPLPGPYQVYQQCRYWAKYWKRTDVSTGDEADFLSDYLTYLG